jgi:hypothetical protein
MAIRKCCPLIAAYSLVAACGSSPPQSPAMPTSRAPLTGTWAATIRVENCTGSPECIALDTSSFVMRLVQDGSDIHGSAYVAGASLDVNGAVDPSGLVKLTTRQRADFALRELSIRSDATLGLVGTIQYTAAPIAVRAQITSAKRGPLEPTLSLIQGTWVGNSSVRACTYTGWTECPRFSRLFRLSLQQSASAISGNLDFSFEERFRVPVRGAFSSMLTLDGVSTRQEPGGTYQLRLLTWTSRSDAFGRMTGSFVYEEESVQPDHRNLARYESELQDVYLLPDWLPNDATAIRSSATQPLVDGIPASAIDEYRLARMTTTMMPLRRLAMIRFSRTGFAELTFHSSRAADFLCAAARAPHAPMCSVNN